MKIIFKYKKIVFVIVFFTFIFQEAYGASCPDIPLNSLLIELENSRKVIKNFPIRLTIPDYFIKNNNRCYIELIEFEKKSKDQKLTMQSEKHRKYFFNKRGKLLHYEIGFSSTSDHCFEQGKNYFLNQNLDFYINHLEKLREKETDLPKKLALKAVFTIASRGCTVVLSENSWDHKNQYKYYRFWEFDLTGELFKVSELYKEKLSTPLTDKEIKKRKTDMESELKKYER